ncbi:MAG: thioredoxin fold domain-containing protein [Gammaproteobacteria bacterium]|nr:thioredoxin fold domain-containing protein [Gammaproteobacteria bacterium]
MKTLQKCVAFLLLMATCTLAISGPSHPTTSALDWSQEASLARASGLPIMVIFSADHCPYCARLKKEVLEPLVKSGRLKQRVILKEFNIDSGGKIIDFDGEPIRSRIFVKRYEIYATPTVVLVDYQGHPLTEPIVGFNGPDSYTEHLDDAINTAVMTLAALRSPRFAQLDQVR